MTMMMINSLSSLTNSSIPLLLTSNFVILAFFVSIENKLNLHLDIAYKTIYAATYNKINNIIVANDII